MNQATPTDQDRRVDDALQDFLKERSRILNMTIGVEVNVLNEIPWWARIAVLLLSPLGILLTRVFWRPLRWAAGNQIASNHSAGSFREFARKFMEQGSGERPRSIQQDEINRLLVDAFMEDLRRGYRRSTLFGVGRCRTTYPVLLIDRIGSTAAGRRLLELISVSRTDHLRKDIAGPGRQPRESDYFHPLLIIAQGDSSALDGMELSNFRPEDHDSYAIADIKYYYRKWYRALADSDHTWFIPLRVPIERPPGLRAGLTEIRLPAAPQPVMTFVAAAPLIAAAPITTSVTYDTHCDTWYWEPFQSRVIPNTDRYQCVGLGSSDHRFFDSIGDIDMDRGLALDLKDVEGKIYGANEEAIKDPRYLTIVYLSQLSSRDVYDYRSELEQLRGLAVAQKRSMADRPVRILLANAGHGMDYGMSAAEAIARKAREDDTLVAVVGLGISRKGTQDAIKLLAGPDAPIPMIGTVISATDLAINTSIFYHQVGPTNQRQAEVGAFYAQTQLGARNATIYYSSDKNDLYSNDLKDQAERAFKARGLAVRQKPYRINPSDDGDDISLAGQDACDIASDGIAFYAGRASQLSVFLKGMQDKCDQKYPHFLGGDAVSRFVLDGGLGDFRGLTVDYLSPASSLAWRSDCSGLPNDIDFFDDYRELFPQEGVCSRTRSGGSLLAYDTLLVFIQGVRNTGIDRPSSEELLRGIERISSEGEGVDPLSGVSGKIDYPRTGDQSIPKDKTILVLRGQAEAEPKRMLLCGQHDTAQPATDDCSAPLGP